MYWPAVCLLAAAAGLFRLRRARDKAGLALALAGLAGIFLWSSPVVAWLLADGLEHSYPITRYPAREAQALVVLGGSLYPSNPSQPETEPGQSTYLRCAHAAWLFHNWKPLPVLVSGGVIVSGQPPLAAVMSRQLRSEGVPEGLIWMEDRSSTTYENAVYAADLLRPRGIRSVVLVTEALHMPRAERVFRKQGFDVIPAPCSYKTLDLGSAGSALLPSVWGIRTTEESLHEYFGLLWYLLRGRL